MQPSATAVMALMAMIASNAAATTQSRSGTHQPPTALPAPVVFAPGVISGPQNDGTPTFSRDGSMALFERTLGNRTIIFETHRVKSAWSRPQVASFSGPWNDQHPALAPDGSYVVFASVRPQEPGTAPGARNVAHLWRTDRVHGGWGAPYELPPTVNISDRVFRPSIAANGDLYFMSASEVGPSGPRWRLYRSISRKGGYSPAEALPFSDGKAADVDPYVAPDGSYLVFSSQGRDTPDDGHERLYFSRRAGSAWGPVRALRYAGDDWGADDGEAVVTPDGRTLLFSSARSAPVDRSTDRAAMVRDIARRAMWDNGATNVWQLPMPELLRANGL